MHITMTKIMKLGPIDDAEEASRLGASSEMAQNSHRKRRIWAVTTMPLLPRRGTLPFLPRVEGAAPAGEQEHLTVAITP
jgi:hypothetical protein